MPKKSRDRAEWERTKYAEATKRVPERAKFETTYGAPLPPIFDPNGTDPGLPGEPPFTRGIQPTMYRGRLWTMRQYAGFGIAEESNARYRYLLEHGQTGLSVAFDLPTQMGYDADDPRVAGEVGKVGVSISSFDDFARLFEGIPIGQVTTSMTINATAAILLAMYVAIAKRQGVADDRVGGTTQNDILKEYIARGTYIFPPRPSMRLATDLIAYCSERHPRWNPISISGYHIREAGADAVQELAFTFADAIAYVDAALERGLDVDRFAPQLSFFFAAHSTLLEEVAKFRAARRVWASIMRDRYGAKAPASLALRFHTQTMGSTLTAQQPQHNIVRTAIEDSAYKQQRAVESKEKVIVGVNAYRAQGGEAEVPITRVDPAVVERQRSRLAALRARRDSGRAQKARADLVAGARGTANLVPLILAAVEADVTLGEICADLREVFGTYVPPRL